MHPTDELVPILKKLGLSGILQSLELRVRKPRARSEAPGGPGVGSAEVVSFAQVSGGPDPDQ